MTYQTLEDIFEGFKKLNVLIIGDVMIDTYIYGSVSRVSPEAPVPIVNVKHREKRLGGAANVALNVQAMGASPILCSVIGEDREADIFYHLLKEKNISSKGIIKSTERITTVKNRILSGSQHMLRIDSETDKALSPLEEKSLLGHIANLIAEADLIIFEDYDKGTLNPNVIAKTVAMAKQKGIPTVVDPKKRNFLAYEGVDLFKPNLKELKEGLKLEFDASDKSALQGAIAKLAELLKFSMAMVTLSEHGMYLKGKESEHHIAAHVRRIADVSGAGDTVVSIAGLSLALGLPARMIGELSNLGGGLVCEYLGVVPVDSDRLLDEAKKYGLEKLLG